MKLGYKLMSEEHGPSALVRNTVRAEQAGFDFAAISDHFSPWLDEQGHSPFAWSVLGAAAQATKRIGMMTAVTCPTMRYHPAIVAQAAATLALLSGDRFILGLGSGERLNEHIVGEGWPGVRERRQRLSEALDVIRALLTGSSTFYQGDYFKIDHARLFDRPQKPPAIVVAAGGEEAAELAGKKGDGLMTTVPKAELVKSYRKAGGKGARYAEIPMCYAADEAKAREIAHRYHRWSLAGGLAMPELPHTEAFAAASAHIPPDAVTEEVSCGPDPERHLAAIRSYADAGYDHLILMQIGPEQDAFFGFFEKELRPRLARRLAA
jgi:G6PDH family F420-dependent oxidoreductase